MQINGKTFRTIWFDEKDQVVKIIDQTTQHIIIHNFRISKFEVANFQIARPGFHFGVPKKHDVATKLISYERYGEILFQKFAPGYLLHFAQDGS